MEDAVGTHRADELLHRAGVGELAVEEADAVLARLVALARPRGVAALDDVEHAFGGGHIGRKSTWGWYVAKAFLSLLLVVAMSVGMQGIALADPWPDDSPNPSGPAVGIPNILPTLPFQLGEVGTTALGVSDTELAGVGLSGIDPADSATSSSGSL